jgi:hypothetical protein
MKRLWVILLLLFILSCEDKVEKDTTPPEVTIISPSPNSTVSEIVNVKCVSTDDKGVEKVELWINGVSTDSTDNSEPYSIEWVTTIYDDGTTQTLTVRSYDVNGNVADSSPITVIVDNSGAVPNEVVLNQITQDNGSLIFSWSKNNDSDFKSYILYESSSSDMSGKTEIHRIDDNNTTSYTLTGSDITVEKFYQITVQDIYGLESHSNTISSIIKFTFLFGEEDMNNTGQDVQQTEDGGYVIIGTSGKNGGDALLIKTDAVGKEEWRKEFDDPQTGGNRQLPYSIQLTSEGGFIIAGVNSNYPWLLKTDANGEQEWRYKYRDVGHYGGGSAFYAQQTSDGGYMMVAQGRKKEDDNKTSFWLVKTTSQGIKEWDKYYYYVEDYDSQAHSGQQTSDGGYVIGGKENKTHNGFIIKTDSEGNEQWRKLYERNDKVSVEINSIRETSGGGFILAGNVLIKTDSNGNEQWKRDFMRDTDGYAVEYYESIMETSDGGFILCGRIPDNFGGTDISVLKTDSNGNNEWAKSFGGEEWDLGYSARQTSDNGYIIVGRTNIGNKDKIILIKLDARGESAQ